MPQLVLSSPFFLTPRVGQNIALHASHAAENSAFLYSHFIQLHIIKPQMACIITVNQIFTCDVVNCVQFCDFLSNCQCNDGSTHLALFVHITVSDLDHSSLSQQYQNCSIKAAANFSNVPGLCQKENPSNSQ